jgi:uncharacterized membrane protein YjfL (UPF0719 family)
MENVLTALLKNFLFVAIALIQILVLKRFADSTTKVDDDQEINNGNFAIGARRFGLYFGFGIGISGALSSVGGNFTNDLLMLMRDGFLVAGFLFLARKLNEVIILPGICNDDECTNGNVAVGIIEAGSYIATGLVAQASSSGQGGGFLSLLIFFVLGQVFLLTIAQISKATTSFSLVEEIKQRNVAASIMLAGKLVSIGIILRSAIAGNFVSWSADISSFITSAVIGMIILCTVIWPIEKFLLPGANLTKEIKDDKNTAVASVVVSVKVVVALIIGGRI